MVPVPAGAQDGSIFLARLVTGNCFAVVSLTRDPCDCRLDFVQIAFVAGNTYMFVKVLAAMLYLATQDQPSGGYSPSNSMVRTLTIQSLLTSSTLLLTGHCLFAATVYV